MRLVLARNPYGLNKQGQSAPGFVAKRHIAVKDSVQELHSTLKIIECFGDCLAKQGIEVAGP